jgi:hypothetical protein
MTKQQGTCGNLPHLQATYRLLVGWQNDASARQLAQNTAHQCPLLGRVLLATLDKDADVWCTGQSELLLCWDIWSAHSNSKSPRSNTDSWLQKRLPRPGKSTASAYHPTAGLQSPGCQTRKTAVTSTSKLAVAGPEPCWLPHNLLVCMLFLYKFMWLFLWVPEMTSHKLSPLLCCHQWPAAKISFLSICKFVTEIL